MKKIQMQNLHYIIKQKLEILDALEEKKSSNLHPVKIISLILGGQREKNIQALLSKMEIDFFLFLLK